MKTGKPLAALSLALLFAIMPVAQGKPRIVMTLGEPAVDPAWVRCTITPDEVRVLYYPFYEGQSFTRPAGLDAEKFRGQIIRASRSELSQGVHVMETIPHVHMAAETQGLPLFTLLYDASGYDRRVGVDADELIGITEGLCGNLVLNTPGEIE